MKHNASSNTTISNTPDEHPSNWVLDQNSNHATTCIVCGRLEDPQEWEVCTRYQHVLWFVDRNSAEACTLPLPQVHLGIIEDLTTDNLNPLLERFLCINGIALPDLKFHQNILQHNTQAFNYISEQIQKAFDLTYRARNTRQQEAHIWQRHVFQNLNDYIANKVNNHWKDIAVGKHAAVIGAGPSLDQSLYLIKKNRKRFTVFAADSALNSLDALGIEPDYTVSIDASKSPQECCSAEINPGHLILDAVSPHSWLQHEPHQSHHFLSGNLLTLDWLSENGIERTPIASLGNCGISALVLAQYMGFSSIALFGMDMASNSEDPSQRHASNANTDIDRGQNYNVHGSQSYIPGNYEEKVPTFMLHEWYAMNEALLKTDPDCTIYNINDRGARFENVELLTPEAAENKFLEFAETDQPVVPPVSTAFASDMAQTVHNKVRENTVVLEQYLELLESHLARNEHTALLQILAAIFQDNNLSRFLGCFSLKTLPYIINIDQAASDFFPNTVRELKELVAVLKQNSISN